MLITVDMCDYFIPPIALIVFALSSHTDFVLLVAGSVELVDRMKQAMY